MLGQQSEPSPRANAKATRTEAEGIVTPPPPPRVPRRKDGPSLLAHYRAINRWLEDEVHSELHGKDAIDRGANRLSKAFDRLREAPCRTREDALAKLQLLQDDDDAQGICGDEVKRPIIDQVAAFLGSLEGAPSDAADDTVWAAAVEQLEEAKAKSRKADAEEEAAEQAAEAEVEAIAIHPEILLPDGTALDIEELRTLPPALRERLSGLAGSYRSACDDVYQRYALNEHGQTRLAASMAVSAARERVLALTPPDDKGLLLQMRLIALHQHYIDLESPEDVFAALSGPSRTDKTRHAQEFIYLYRHACRLACFDSATAAVTAWDANAFIDAFEAHPGHYMARRGPLFLDHEMPGYISDNDVALRDPDRIRKYDDLCGRRTAPRTLIAGIVVTNIDRLREVYSDMPEEGERLITAVKAYGARAWMKDWPGSDMWSGLKDWQKDAVREAMVHRVDREQVRRLVEGATIALVETGPPADWAETASTVDDYLERHRARDGRIGEPWSIDIAAARAKLLGDRPRPQPMAAE